MRLLHGPVQGVGVLSPTIALTEDGLFLRVDVGGSATFLNRQMARQLARALDGWADA